MKCSLFLGAQTILIDHLTKRASAINILENVTSPNFPFMLPVTTLSFYEREEGDEDDALDESYFLQIDLNDKTLLGKYKLDIHIDKESRGAKNLANMGALLIQEAGKLEFNLFNSTSGIVGKFTIHVLSQQSSATAPIVPSAFS